MQQKSFLGRLPLFDKGFVRHGFLLLVFVAAIALFPTSASAASRYFVGTGSGAWNNPANWSTAANACGVSGGASVPVAADVAYFVSNCTNSATMNTDVTIAGINIAAGYSGAISPSSVIAITIGSTGYVQAGGTFTATSGTTTLTGPFTKTGGTFTHNNGTFVAAGINDRTYNFSTPETFNNFTVANSGARETHIIGQPIIVLGTLTLTSGMVMTGTIDARGDITQASTFYGGTAYIDFGNNDIAQTYTLNGGIAPHIRFNHDADKNDSVVIAQDASIYGLSITADFGNNDIPLNYGTPNKNVTIGLGGITQASGIFTAPNVLTNQGPFTKTGGTFTHNNGTFVAAGINDRTYNFSTPETFNNFTVANSGARETRIIGQPIIVLSTLTLTSGMVIAGTIDARGDITQASTFYGGTTYIDFGNNELTQTYTINGGIGPHLRFDSVADASDSMVMTAAGSLYGLTITSDFSGSLPVTRNGYALSIGNGGFTLQADVTVDLDIASITGPYTQSAGTFVPASAITLSGFFTKTGGEFVEGTGTVTIAGGNANYSFSTSESFYNVTIQKNPSADFNIISQSMIVHGTLNLVDGDLNIGTLDMRGATIIQADTFDGGTGIIDFGNNDIAQTYTLNGGIAPHIRFNHDADKNDSVVIAQDASIYGLSITADFGNNDIPLNYGTPNKNVTIGAGGIAQASGILTAPNVLTNQGPFTKTGGTFDHNNGTFVVASTYNISYNFSTPETFNNFTVANGNTRDMNIIGSSVIVLGTLLLTDGEVMTGVIDARGDISLGVNFDGGTAPLVFSGSNVQTFTTNNGSNFNADIFINKSGGQVNLVGNLIMDAASQDLIIQEGTLDLNGSNLTVTGGATQTLIVQDGGVLRLQGNETITASATYPQFQVGSTAYYDGSSGPYTIKDYAYSNLTIDGVGTIFNLPSTKTLRNLTVTAGTLDVTENHYNLTLNGNLTVAPSAVLNNRSNTVTFNDQNQTITGDVTFNNFSKVKSTFSPSDFATNALWLDGDDLSSFTLNGSLVTQWRDKSGNNRHATPGSAGTEPSLNSNGLNDRDTVAFGIGDGMNIAYTLSAAPYTLFIVYDTSGASTARRAIQGSVNNWLIGPYTGTHRHYGNNFNNGPSVVTDEFVIAGTTNNGTAAYFYVNGTSYTTATTYTGVPGTLCIGGSAGNGVCGAYSEPLEGDIAEIIVYSSVLASEDRENLECYLSQKWGIELASSCSSDFMAGDSTLTFTAGSTTTVNGTLTLTGLDNDNRVNLVSSSLGSRWNLIVNGTQNVTWVDVRDSDASGGDTITHANTADSGNNVSWGFDESAPTITDVDSDTADGTYGAGSVIDLDFTFSEAITTTGDITVSLNSGGSCTFTGVISSSTATCNYTVLAGENILTALAVTNLSGTIRDQSGNQMTDFTPTTNLNTHKTILIDTTAPRITAISSDKPNGRYKAGEVIDIDITFSKAVTTNGTAVTVTLETGTTDRTCTFSIPALSHSLTASCDYTVQAGDTTNTDPLTVSSISGTMTDAYGNAMTNFIPVTNLAVNKALVIDTTAPTILSVTSNKTNGTYGAGEVIDIDVTFSENVTSVGSITVTLETGTTDRTCTFTITNNVTASCNYTVQSGDTSLDLDVSSISGTINDIADNALTNFIPTDSTLAENKDIVIDASAPVILSVSSDTANGRFKAGSIIDIDLTFSTEVTSTGDVTVTLDTGGTCAFTVTNSTTASCDYTVQAGHTSNDLNVTSITGTLKDQSDVPMTDFVPFTNLAANKAIVIDTTAPTIPSVTSNKPNGQYTTGTVIDIRVNFSEAVTATEPVTVTLDTGDTDRTCTFTLSNASTGVCNYTVQEGDSSLDLDVLSIATSGTLTDQAGNLLASLTPATTLAQNKDIVINTVAPVITNVTSDKANGRYTVGEVIDIDVSFSKEVTSDGNVTVTLETGTSDRTCTFTVTNATSGTCDYTIQAGDTTSDLTVKTISGTMEDAFGNPMVNFVPQINLGTNKNILIDTTAPLLSSHTPIDNATGIAQGANLVLRFTETVVIGAGNITIRKSVDDSLVEAIDVTSGQVTGGQSSVVTINPSADFLPLTEYYAEVPSAAFEDLTGNAFAGIIGTSAWSFTIGDPDAPTIVSVTSTKPSGTYSVGSTIAITVTFSEAVSSNGLVTVTFDTGRTCTFTVLDAGSGNCNYIVQAGDTSADLDVLSVSGDMEDQFNNALTDFTPLSTLAAGGDIVIDTDLPYMVDLSPADDSTGIALDADLVITFNTTIGKAGTGTVTIKKTADSSTLEKIAVTGSLVTGSGTDTMTINPSVTLLNDTAYHIQISGDAFPSEAGNFFGGIFDETTWNFRTVALASSSSSSRSSDNGSSGGGGQGGRVREITVQNRITVARESIVNRFERLLAAAPAQFSSSSTSSSSSSSGPAFTRTLPASASSSSAVAMSSPAPVALGSRNGKLTAVIDEKSLVFRDVSLTAWYAPYVATLVEEKVAVGYKDAKGQPTGVFGVEKSVTYAEVLKMALGAAGETNGRGLPRNTSARGGWASTYVAKAEEMGISVFTPELNVHTAAPRGAVIQILLEAMEMPIGPKKETGFTDVPLNHRFARAIATAAFMELIEGDLDMEGKKKNMFRPDAPINRAEVAKIIALARELLR